VSNAQLFFEAVDTAITLGRAAIGWLIFFGVAATMFVLAAIATGAWGVNALRRRLRARPATEQTPDGPSEPREPHKPEPRTPSWAHTQPIDCEEAA
jgi:hypothetical protein